MNEPTTDDVTAQDVSPIAVSTEETPLTAAPALLPMLGDDNAGGCCGGACHT